MVEVHGGDLSFADPGGSSGAGDGGITDSQIGDAGDAYEAAMEAHDWHSVQTFVTPYRHEGKKTMGYEILEQLDWSVPDAVVYPTGGGVGLVGIHKAARELRQFDRIGDLPGLYAAQSSGCAPIVEAVEAGRDRHEPWTDVDTVCGGIAIPDPGASDLILDAIAESDGGAVATDDDEILDAAVHVARETGIEMAPTCAAAASGAFELAARGAFGSDDTVVILNTGAGNKDADVLRAHVGRRRSEVGE
jgi:threonine synthase